MRFAIKCLCNDVLSQTKHKDQFMVDETNHYDVCFYEETSSDKLTFFIFIRVVSDV